MPHKNDIALPIAELEAFCAELERFFEARYPGWEIALFGHIGDGNLHVNVMKPDELERAEFLKKTKEADHAIFELVKKHHGSISAEHGVGLLKKVYLGYSRAPEELALMTSSSPAPAAMVSSVWYQASHGSRPAAPGSAGLRSASR